MFTAQMKGRVLALLLGLGATVPASAFAQDKLNQYGNPLKHPPKPTTAAITAEELRTRLYIFADDTMEGRRVATVGNMKGTAYIASELKRLGIEPGGDNGGYFQRLPYVVRKFNGTPSLTLNGTALTYGADFVPVPGARAPKAISNVPVIFGGLEGDTTRQITPAQAAGKFVVMSVPAGAAPAGGRGGGGGGGGVGAASVARFPNAVAIAIIDLDALSPAQRMAINNPTTAVSVGGGRGGPPSPDTGPMPGGVARPNPDFKGITGDLVVTNDFGGVAIIRGGKLVSGKLPTGRTVEQVMFSADSSRRVESLIAAGTAARRDSLVATAKALAAAGAKTGSFAFYGETMTLDSTQIATLAAAAGGGRGAGGRGGLPGAGGRGGAPGGAPAPTTGPLTAIFRISSAAVTKFFGNRTDGLQPGATGGTVSANLDWSETPSDWARNVIGIVRGSDPKLKAEYVIIGAHNDHNGYTIGNAVDHDSMKAANDLRIRAQFKVVPGDLRALPPAQAAAIKVNMDSIRKLYPVVRLDSITNGADDDGSGSMAVLEIAEAVSKMPVKPKRSTIFIWHTGEESGLLGAQYFAANPTVPIDSIIAGINIDMIGRGRAEDMVGGGPNYVGAVGSQRLSKELNRQMLAVNAREPASKRLRIDYRFDDPTLGTSVDGKPVSWPGYNNIYGRSDHARYADKCIPIVFFFTGLHGDYHQRTDEPQYIDYPHYAMITDYIKDLLVDVGNRPVRPALDNVCTRR